MKVRQLIAILESIEDKEQDVVTLARYTENDTRDTYRGISQVFKERDVLSNPRIVLADGTKGR